MQDPTMHQNPKRADCGQQDTEQHHRYSQPTQPLLCSRHVAIAADGFGELDPVTVFLLGLNATVAHGSEKLSESCRPYRDRRTARRSERCRG